MPPMYVRSPLSTMSKVQDEQASFLLSLLASNFDGVDERVLSLPRRRHKLERSIAQQVASIMFPSFTPEKAVIQYEVARLRARRVFLKQQRIEEDKRRKILEYSKLQGPWDPVLDPVPNDGPTAEPMPVEIGTQDDFKDVFAFLAADIQPSDDIVTGTEPIWGTPFVEFPRGLVYNDGRLDLCKKVVGPDHISELMRSLETNSVVRHFLLGNNVITNHGARCIAGFIRHHPDRMETWYLAGNHIKPQGFKELAEALCGSSTLTNLWMKRNPLGSTSATGIAELIQRAPKLRTLDLETTELGDVGVNRIFSSIADSSCEVIPLQTIYLNGNGIGGAACAAIARFLQTPQCRLTGLFLGCNPLGDEGAGALSAGLAKNQTLLRLSMTSCGMTGKGIQIIAASLANHDCIESVDFTKAITTIDLNQRFNHIDDSAIDGLVKLVANPAMRYLDLGRTALTIEGVSMIQAAVIKSNLVIFSASSIQANFACSKDVRDRLVENHVRFYDDNLPYNLFRSPHGPARYLRNDKDVRLIDSVYRTRDKRLPHKASARKYWEPKDALWYRLDAIQ